jgi:hypothetical protein
VKATEIFGSVINFFKCLNVFLRWMLDGDIHGRTIEMGLRNFLLSIEI